MNINWANLGVWLLRGIAAYIMLQTLTFKFTAAEESVYIFSKLGMEPWGRIGTGVLELIASLLYPRTTAFGAALGAGMMSGAIFFHLTKLGISLNGSVLLFIYGVVAFTCCVVLMIIYRNELISFTKQILGKSN
jgi:hypothetical protein